jgi:CBS domain-containing protein
MPERPVRSLLGRRRLGPALVTAGPDATAREAARRMAETCRGGLLVVEDGTRLREVMRADFETIDAEAPVAEAVRRMDEGGLRHLPVVEGERVLGVLSSRDIPALALGSMARELHERHRLAERAW